MDDQFFRRQREVEQRREKEAALPHSTIETHYIEQETARKDPATLRPKAGLEDPTAVSARNRMLIVGGLALAALAVVLVLVISNGGL